MENQSLTCSSPDLLTFVFDGEKDVRTLIQDQEGNSWIILNDVLSAMGTTTPITKALESIHNVLGDGFTRSIPILDNMGRYQPTYIVTESAATFLVSRSNTEKSKKLNRWLHTEVIPSIRKTGSYGSQMGSDQRFSALEQTVASLAKTVENLTQAQLAASKQTRKRLPAPKKEFLPVEILAQRHKLHLLLPAINGMYYSYQDVAMHVLREQGLAEGTFIAPAPTEKAKGQYRLTRGRSPKLEWDAEDFKRAAEKTFNRTL